MKKHVEIHLTGRITVFPTFCATDDTSVTAGKFVRLPSIAPLAPLLLGGGNLNCGTHRVGARTQKRVLVHILSTSFLPLLSFGALCAIIGRRRPTPETCTITQGVARRSQVRDRVCPKGVFS